MLRKVSIFDAFKSIDIFINFRALRFDLSAPRPRYGRCNVLTLIEWMKVKGAFMRTSILARSLAALLALSMIGCGQGYRSSATGSSNLSLGLGNNGVLDTKVMEAATADAQLTIDSAQLSLDSVVDADGNVQIFNKSAVDVVLEIGKIKKKLMKKLDAVLVKVTAVKAKFNLVRSQIAAQIAKLDSTLPANAEVIRKLNEGMAKLDLIEANFNKGIQFLVSKLDMANAALDKLSGLAQDAAGSINPIFGGVTGLVADLVIGQIKDVINEFKMKIQAI